MENRRRSIKARPTTEERSQTAREQYRAEQKERRQIQFYEGRHSDSKFDTPEKLRAFRDLGLKGQREFMALGMQPGAWKSFAGQQAERRKNELTQLQAAADSRAGPQANETELAGYLYRRSVDKRPVEGALLDTLRAGNQSVEETRNRLSMGRGNLSPDIRRTHHESTHRTEIAREMVDGYTDQHTAPKAYGQTSATAAEFTRAGNCGEHADVATHVHASKMAPTDPGQTVAASHATVDHAWSEYRQRAGRKSASDVIIDAWGKGSAVLREDSAFAHTASQVKASYGYVAGQKRAMTRAMQAQKAQLDTPDNRRIASERLDDYRRRDFKYAQKSVWAPTPVASQSFRQTTDSAIQKLGSKTPAVHGTGGDNAQVGGLLREIHAAGVLRSLGANVGSATRGASDLVKKNKP